jgi:hypothetical protein
MCVLVALALIPTLIHSYAPNPASDVRVADAIPTELAGYRGSSTGRTADWGKRRFDSDDWIERAYRDGKGGRAVRLTVVRSYDAKSLYHHPELAITYPQAGYVGEEIRRFDERRDIPVYVLKPQAGEKTAALYALHYEGRFIENPIAFQIRTAAELLFSRRKPMTLFFVFDRAPDKAGERVSAATVLFDAIDSFLGRQPIPEPSN